MSNRFSKYHSQKTIIDGITFASKAEAELYCLLKKKYAEVFCQPKIYLTRSKILYRPDFFADGIYFEMKGMELPIYRLKRRLWLFYGPGQLHVYKKVREQLKLIEVLWPDAIRKAEREFNAADDDEPYTP